MKTAPLPYLPAMFATCMMFMALYVLCVLLWAFFPGLAGHGMLTAVFPQFRLLDMPSFFYGMIMSAMYGWFIAALFVFFYNFWPKISRLLLGDRP